MDHEAWCLLADAHRNTITVVFQYHLAAMSERAKDSRES